MKREKLQLCSSPLQWCPLGLSQYCLDSQQPVVKTSGPQWRLLWMGQTEGNSKRWGTVLTIIRPPWDRSFKSLLRFTFASISITTSTPSSPTAFCTVKGTRWRWAAVKPLLRQHVPQKCVWDMAWKCYIFKTSNACFKMIQLQGSDAVPSKQLPCAAWRVRGPG